MAKSTQEVFEHHMQALNEGVDSVLTDYSVDSVLITQEMTFRGNKEIQSFFTEFFKNTPDAVKQTFTIKRQELIGEIAYLVWEAKPLISLATDTFVIRNGKIAYQTVATYWTPPA